MTNESSRGIRFQAFVSATHFPQALAMVLLMTLSTALLGGSWWNIVFVLLASAAGQATVGWTNDVHDAEADLASGRRNKPTVRGEVRPDELRRPIVIAAVLAVPFSFVAAGWVGGIAHIVAVASALMYNYVFARTAWSWSPYAVSFALMPVFIAQAVSPALWPSPSVTVLSVLVGVTAHLLNAIPDIAIDRESGFGGLAVSLGKRRSQILAAVLVVCAVVCAALVISPLLAN